MTHFPHFSYSSQTDDSGLDFAAAVFAVTQLDLIEGNP